MEVLALVPARGGSKGVPRKNVRLLGNKPLLAWSVEKAQKAKTVNRVIVSTEDTGIAEISKKWGGEVPFIRPAEFSQDETTDLPVYQHALRWLKKNEGYIPDIVVWLRPTAPFRLSSDIDAAVKKIIVTKADWVRSVCEVEHHPYWMFNFDDDRLISFIKGIKLANYPRRQMLPSVYRLNGAVDVTWSATITEKGLFYEGDVCGYIMPIERSIDIDTEEDFLIAKAMLKRQHGERRRNDIFCTNR